MGAAYRQAGHTPDFPALGEGVIGMHLGNLRLGILVVFEEGTGWPIGIQGLISCDDTI